MNDSVDIVINEICKGFWKCISPDAWIQSIASLIGAFLAGGFAIWVLYKQINYDKTTKQKSTLNDSIRVYERFRMIYEQVLFRMDVILILLRTPSFDEGIKTILIDQTEQVDKIIQELKNTSTGEIPEYVNNIIYITNNLIESSNEMAKGLINHNLSSYEGTKENYEEIRIEIDKTILILNEYSDVTQQQLDNLN